MPSRICSRALDSAALGQETDSGSEGTQETTSEPAAEPVEPPCRSMGPSLLAIREEWHVASS